ncbi:hypothetical protein GF386_00690 [Candidatus Pacearchaeota archaeon]|nr:hypothetical protein [Candidatus Pacearchaeota archaeon]MBD3282772.1 hypothetical protein [Candidatus Pacearchaeota archaeon]
MEKQKINKLALTIIVSVILTIILVSLVNVGISIFYDSPEYNDFCGEVRPSPVMKENETIVCAQDVKECPDGTTVSRDPARNCEFPPCKSEFQTCQEEYDKARESYNQVRFYILAVIGFALLLVGLFSPELLFQITGLATGGILVTEGIVTNFENKVVVFISLLLILVIFGIVAWRVINKKKD